MEEYIKLLLKLAKKALKNNEIPVGAIIVKDNKVISTGINDRQSKHNVMGHAEINAILSAERKIKDWRLDDCEMYVTLHPCDMCSSIIRESRIKRVYYLLEQDKLTQNENYVKIKVNEEYVEKYKQMLQNFFEQMRQN